MTLLNKMKEPHNDIEKYCTTLFGPNNITIFTTTDKHFRLDYLACKKDEEGVMKCYLYRLC